MNDKRPFFCRTIWGLRPGQWLIVIGVMVMVIPNIVMGTPLRVGQWLMLIGTAGIVAARIATR